MPFHHKVKKKVVTKVSKPRNQKQRQASNKEVADMDQLPRLEDALKEVQDQLNCISLDEDEKAALQMKHAAIEDKIFSIWLDTFFERDCTKQPEPSGGVSLFNATKTDVAKSQEDTQTGEVQFEPSHKSNAWSETTWENNWTENITEDKWCYEVDKGDWSSNTGVRKCYHEDSGESSAYDSTWTKPTYGRKWRPYTEKKRNRTLQKPAAFWNKKRRSRKWTKY
jgi:hypothetical protein